MKIVSLDKVAKFINGYAFKPSGRSTSGLKIIRIQNLTDLTKPYNRTNEHVDNRYIVKRGDILVSWSATLDVFEWHDEDALLNQHIFKVEHDATVIDKYYFKYVLKQTIEAMKQFTHGSTMKHIVRKDFLNHKIPLPSIEDQKRIVRELDAADALRQKRKQAITLLDDYLKAMFLEMFGDPVMNPKGWKMQTIEQIVKKEKYSIKRGPFGGALKKEIFVENGYLVYEQFHALNNDFSMARYFIDDQKFNELKAFEVKAGDIIISCSGVYLGKLAVVPNGSKKGIINQALLKVSLDEMRMNNVLFTYIFTNENFKNKFFGQKIGSGIPNFPPMSDFKKFQFICPPIELQNKFVEIVKKTEQLKQIMLIQSDHLEANFNALMETVFKS